MAKKSLIPVVALAAGAAILLASGGASASTKSNTNTNNQGKEPGDEGMPAGPNGCKPGLVEKNGICSLPGVGDNTGPLIEEPGKNNGGGGGYTPTASSLTISSKCDNFTFGDKTGEAYWNKWKSTAQTWISKGWTNPLQIAYKMLKGKNTQVCFKDFPDFDEYQNKPAGQAEYALIEWLRTYPKIWELVWWLRNKIDMTFFQGETAATINPKTWKVTEGEKFDFDMMWENGVKQLAAILYYLEQEEPGILLNNKKEANDLGLEILNTATYLFWILFPNIDFITLMKKYKQENYNIKIPFWGYLADKISDLDNMDLEFDPGDVIPENA